MRDRSGGSRLSGRKRRVMACLPACSLLRLDYSRGPLLFALLALAWSDGGGRCRVPPRLVPSVVTMMVVLFTGVIP